MRELGDWAAVPMILLVFSILSIVSAPIGNAISRQLEHNADIYGLEVTHDINPTLMKPPRTPSRCWESSPSLILIPAALWCSGMPTIHPFVTASPLPTITIPGAKASSRST